MMLVQNNSITPVFVAPASPQHIHTSMPPTYIDHQFILYDFRIKTIFGSCLHLLFVGGRMLYHCSVCLRIVMSNILSYHMSIGSELRVVMSDTIPAWKRCSVHIYHQLFARGITSYLRYLCLLAHIGVQLILTMRETCRVSYKRQELLSIRGRLGSLTVFDGIRALYRFRLLGCWCFFCYVCLHPVSRVPNVVSLSGLSILDFPFGFL